MSTAFFSHQIFEAHDTGPGHPERAERLRAIKKVISSSSYDTLIRREAPRSTLQQIAMVHDLNYVEKLMKEHGEKESELELVKSSSVEQMWLKELSLLKKHM